MDERTALLVELLLQAELFCSQVETAGKKKLPVSDTRDLRLKISQCRGTLALLQERYENDSLKIDDPVTCTDFRTLVISLMWVTFLARSLIDRKMFRKLVLIESSFTYAIISNSTQTRK